jgi:hypothetical protein
MSFGILTLATPNDYQKAIGLALSARVSNPGVPIAVACSPKVAQLVSPYFDIIVDENRSLRGFEHKVHLDEYTPFSTTFFFDSDIILFRPVQDIVESWGDQSYIACGIYTTDGISSFGQDRAQVLRKIGKERLVTIDGAGHALFRTPDCKEVFDLARDITANYKEYAGEVRYADEDVMNIAMTMLELKPAPHGEFFSRYLSAKPGTIEMNAAEGRCRFEAVVYNRQQEPHMMHFACNEAPFPYYRQLKLVYDKFGVDTAGLLKTAISDYYTNEIDWPLRKFVKSIIKPGK